MQIIIVRHAETIENTFRICQGQRQGQLSERGLWEASQVALRLKDEQIDLCYTSDLKRAADTCARISELNGRFEPVFDTRLRERFFGSMQGKPFPPTYDEAQFPPETESVEAMAGRLRSILDELILKYGCTEERVLLISHGFTIRVLVAILRGWPLSQVWDVPDILNTSVSVFEYSTEEERWHERLFNDASHVMV
ncbi:histidine phosphatase family protein [Porphyromonas sp.]|uniref:histidine phosphatase family protein n=1 Tax=Porphyromonas sp. TaxID=1924944 RepID=UPI0026DD9632|nr:histidine phosphatase family protein [Porphyromonas sp.]MDO4695136.1 histidine phosphatase family protein [Porphyromonas sp.]MDO4770220.1 histidine phosphatase family protein [Porphyromonas sp.]